MRITLNSVPLAFSYAIYLAKDSIAPGLSWGQVLLPVIVQAFIVLLAIAFFVVAKKD